MDSVLKLKALPHKGIVKGPLLLIIMDGIGVGKEYEGNAVWLANTPVLDRLLKRYPYVLLKAHGTAVGLPSDKDMGNSEVGHNALGGGRVFDQGAKLVNRAIETGEIFKTDVWKEIVGRGKKGNKVHLIGLLSDGNVHSHISHLFALLKELDRQGVDKVRVHILLDGRDVPETSALIYVDQLETLLREINSKGRDYRIASGGGRMVVTMDRYEADWRIVERGWRAHVEGEGRKFRSAREAIETYRREQPGIIDQFLPEFVIVDEKGEPVGKIEDGDSVVFFNFRGDRAIEISRAFEEEQFDKFERKKYPKVFYAGMMEYDGDLHIPKNYLVSPPEIDYPLTEFLVALNIRQLACSETQKYGHVTYFWNGNKAGLYNPTLGHFEEKEPIEIKTDRYTALIIESDWEKYVEIPSDRVPFEERPWMKSAEIVDLIIDEINKNRYDFIRINFANGDMVGHTGNLVAARIAVEAVDMAIGRLIQAIKRVNGLVIVTADHGNSDEMIEYDSKGEKRPKTSHTLNPVWFVVVDPQNPDRWEINREVEERGLANVASTILYILGYEKPDFYEPSLVKLKL